MLTATAPIGQRSFSPWTFTPGLTTSLYPNDPFNVATYNNHICIIPQIESAKGMQNIDEIAAVPGISAVMFGPGDFMIDAGIDLKSIFSPTPDTRFLEAMGKFGAAAKKNNLPIFGGCQKVEQVPRLIQQGSRAIAVQFDLWGFTRMIDGSLKSGWEYAKGFEGNPSGKLQK